MPRQAQREEDWAEEFLWEATEPAGAGPCPRAGQAGNSMIVGSLGRVEQCVFPVLVSATVARESWAVWSDWVGENEKALEPVGAEAAAVDTSAGTVAWHPVW